MITRTVKRLFFPALLLILVSGCVMFVSPYDEITDKAITDLENKTELFFVKMDSTKGSYAANSAFYQEAAASIQSIKLRAESYGADKNKGEISELDGLAHIFQDVAALHKSGPLSGNRGDAARELIEKQFRSLLGIELAKKNGVSGGSSAKTQ
jgi:hypothetical protein